MFIVIIPPIFLINLITNITIIKKNVYSENVYVFCFPLILVRLRFRGARQPAEPSAQAPHSRVVGASGALPLTSAQA